MEWQKLCTNCMLATVVNGVCPNCGMPYETDDGKNIRPLPVRCMLHGRYYIGKVLGAGGFGITYLAYDRKKNCRVAVKELFPNKDAVRELGTGRISILKGQEEYFSHIRQRFMFEADVLLQFRNSPDVVKVYDYFEENNTAYYAMEYLEGTDLKSLLKNQGRLGWERLSAYMRMVLRTLNMLHRKNLVHRDISPDNIILTKDGRAMLIDFGSVRCYSNGGGFTIFLKECFAPIEQYQEHGKQGPWTDIYSLSVTMYYALSGVMPPKAPERIQNGQTVPLNELCPLLPDHVAQAIKKGMSVRQEERFQSVQDFAGLLFPGENLFLYACKEMEPQRVRDVPGESLPYRLCCIRGYHMGKKWLFHAGIAITLGRDPRCVISYPVESKGISRLQCSLMMDRQGRVYVRDEKSTCGTFLNGEKLKADQWYRITETSSLKFANELYQVC